MSFLPVDIVRSMQKTNRKRTDQIAQALQKMLDRNIEIDLTIDASYMASNLSQWYSETERSTFNLKMNLILNLQIVNAFMQFVDKNYESAFFSFRWTLQYLSIVRAKYKSNAILNDCRIERIFLNCSLYLAKCLNLDFNLNKSIKYVSKRKIKINRLDAFKGILSNVLENAGVDDIAYPRSILEIYSSAQFFCICAEIYESMAILDGELVKYKHAQDLETLFIAPNPTLSVCMVRHYILASAYLPDNDPYLLLCYHKILMGILFVRGLEKVTFNFFYQKLHQVSRSLNGNYSTVEYANSLLSNTFARVFEIIYYDYKSRLLPPIFIRLNTGEVLIESNVEISDLYYKHSYSKEMRKLKQKMLGSPCYDNGSDLNDNKSYDFVQFWKYVYET